jgi:phasin family protein
MPSKTPAAKRPARKAPAGKPVAKKPAKSKAAAKAPRTAAQSTDTASLGELVSRLSKIEVSGFAGRLVQGWRKDLEVIVQASQHSYAGLQAIVNRQAAQIKEAVAELQSVGTVVATVGATQSVRSLDDLALASLKLALADIRELAAMAATSQREAFELVHQRVNHNIEEVQQLLRK